MKGGFVSIPIIIVIVIGTALAGGVGYVGVQQYQKSAERKALTQTQQETEKIEIQKLREELELLREQQKAPTQEETEPEPQVVERVVEKIVEKPIIVSQPTAPLPEQLTQPQKLVPTLQEQQAKEGYLAKRKAILDQLFYLSDTLNNRQVESYIGTINEIVIPGIASVGSTIVAWQIPNLPFGDYLVKDKNYVRDFQTHLYSIALALKNFEQAFDDYEKIYYASAVDEADAKILETLTNIQNNFEYVEFESNKYFGY